MKRMWDDNYLTQKIQSLIDANTQDISSTITNTANLTVSVSKAIKTGNILTLFIKAKNETGSTINTGTTLFTLSGVFEAFYFIGRTTGGTVVFSLAADGKLSITSHNLGNNDELYLSCSYVF